jgi:hypothetical protein
VIGQCEYSSNHFLGARWEARGARTAGVAAPHVIVPAHRVSTALGGTSEGRRSGLETVLVGRGTLGPAWTGCPPARNGRTFGPRRTGPVSREVEPDAWVEAAPLRPSDQRRVRVRPEPPARPRTRCRLRAPRLAAALCNNATEPLEVLFAQHVEVSKGQRTDGDSGQERGEFGGLRAVRVFHALVV